MSTSTHSPCPNMVLGHGKQRTTINHVFLHSLECCQRAGKSSPLLVLARNSLPGSDTHSTEESALLIPLSLSLPFNFSFRMLSRPFILFQYRKQTLFSLYSFLVNKEDRCEVVAAWASQEPRHWESSLGSTMTSKFNLHVCFMVMSLSLDICKTEVAVLPKVNFEVLPRFISFDSRKKVIFQSFSQGQV